MPLRKVMKSVPLEHMAAKGLFRHDLDAITQCQRECTSRLAMTIQLEQEAYLAAHPEIIAALELYISYTSSVMKRRSEFLKQAAEYFLRPLEDLDADIRKRLGVGPEDNYNKGKKVYHIRDDEKLMNDLAAIIQKHSPKEPWSHVESSVSIPNTESSSFISVKTSESTLPTPEPVPTPEPTFEELMFRMVSNVVDKAIFLHVDDAILNYDTAYVELSKAVEAAMEVPVVLIKEDIHEILEKAYELFEVDIIEKETYAAAIAWEKRMRKKMKRSLRRQDNFKGHETPTTPVSPSSSNESYKRPPPRPCRCHPQWHYNRYDKDRFGIYLPRDLQYDGLNATVTPVLSDEDAEGQGEDVDAVSTVSRKSMTSRVSEKTV
ncbi:uncharacterized protein LOC126380259 [Pectinophora gossypiella]|uniref:uncharacterized protein LOC126380259 n=1 Tax=Pectinophora gossypiella TaxID=13191 RepID=UPI00214EF356|nr:uncharacterized protein LOC126380259 [Pectinophora gossypiella]